MSRRGSVYKINLLFDTAVTFVLTSGGHNAGIVSEPGHPNRRYRLGERQAEARYVDPDNWCATTPSLEGSWWPAWTAWLARQSSVQVPQPELGASANGYAVLGPAPGRYVLEA
jgi:polyhydroxyalkanoate synthase